MTTYGENVVSSDYVRGSQNSSNHYDYVKVVTRDYLLDPIFFQCKVYQQSTLLL